MVSEYVVQAAGGGYGPPGGGPPGGYGPPGGAPPGGYGPPGGPPGGYGPGSPPGAYGPPGGGPPGGGYGGYSPPGYGPGQGPGFPPGPPSGGPSWDPMEAVRFAWSAVTKDFVGAILPIAVALFLIQIPNLALGFLRGFATTMLISSGALDANQAMLLGYVTLPVAWLVTLTVQAFIMGGVVDHALAVARGQKPEFATVFGGGRHFVPMLISTLLYSLGVAAGSVLCIVPGVILYLGWMLYPQCVVVEGKTGVEALSASWQRVQGHKTNLFVYGLLSLLIAVVGVLACCVGAMLVSLPMYILGNAYIYLKLSGEEPRLAA